MKGTFQNSPQPHYSAFREGRSRGCRDAHPRVAPERQRRRIADAMVAIRLRRGPRQRPALAAWLILACIAIAGGSSELSFGQGLDRRWAWHYWEAERWGGAAWSDLPFVYGPLYPGHWYAYSPCYPFASCAAYWHHRLLERRQQRFEALRAQATEAGYPASGAAATSPFSLPSAELAPESELRPEYRDTGKIRPGFEHSGEFLPDFLERR